MVDVSTVAECILADFLNSLCSPAGSASPTEGQCCPAAHCMQSEGL